MGRGVISDGGTDGQYTISLDYGEDIADLIIAQLAAQAAVLESDIDALEAEIALLESSQASLQLLLSASITTYNASEKTDADKETLAQVSASVSSGDQYLQRKNTKLAVKRLTLANTENRISFLQSKSFTETRTVWCADLTEDGTGAVDTIEINGEQGPLILIAPGAPEYSSSAGYLRSRYAMTPEQAFFNAAILPGVQKFKPTFRTGSISAIDYENDTCTVTLDSATSSAQSLSINQASILTGIPVEYMTCNAVAFDNGDDVVVQFEGQSWDDPKVIGFKTNPKTCAPYEIAFMIDRHEQYSDGPYPSEFAGDNSGSPSITYPLEGLERSSGSLMAERKVDFNVIIPETTYSIPRIRWDVAWKKSRSEDEFFEEDVILNYREEDDDKFTVVDVDTSFITPPYTYMVYGNSATFQLATSSLVWTSGPDQDDETISMWAGSVTTDWYYFAGFPEIGSDEYLTSNYSEATSYLLALFNPPASVSIELQEGKFVTYTLQSFGPPCLIADARINHIYFTNPEDYGEGTVTKRVYNMSMAIYRRVPD